MKVGVACTIYISVPEHLELAKQTLDSIQSAQHELYFHAVVNHINPDIAGLDKFMQGFENIEYNDNNSLSKAWNIGIRKCLNRGCDYVLVPNMDLILHRQCVDRLVRAAYDYHDAILWTASDSPEKNPEKMTISEDYNYNPWFSLFLVNDKLFEKVGPFDEEFIFPYNEDNSMHYRIKQLGYIAVKTGTAKAWHFGSGTIKSDLNLERQNVATHGRNNIVYKQMWGGGPGNEKYKNPYNKSDLTCQKNSRGEWIKKES